MLAYLQKEARALTGAGCMLRPDRSLRALFVCDLPARDTALAQAARTRLEQAGFAVAPEAGLWRLDLAPARQSALIEALPPVLLPYGDMPLRARAACLSLLAFGETPACRQPWPPIRRALLLLDAGRPEELLAFLSADTALRKRAHTPLPTAAARLIALFLLDTDNDRIKEAPPC